MLDLVPVRTDQATGDAVRASIDLVRAADRLGFERYWVAEHHNMPSVAATSPPVLIAMLAAATERIRLGSGGVMLPNHAPLVVAEQFALLEAAFPGRIDLGIGRAPGSDPVTSVALRGAAGRGDDDVRLFPQYLDDVVALMGAEGVKVPVPQALSRGPYILKATPAAATVPRLWLLGSSMYSAQLAAEKGLPYVFAHHFSGHGTREALAFYRENFQPSDQLDRPTTFLTANVAVAPTADEARDLARPNAVNMARLRGGLPMHPLALAEDPVDDLPPQLEAIVASSLRQGGVGDPGAVATHLMTLAAEFDVDEVMLHPIASEHVGVAPGEAPARVRSIELLAEALAS